MRTCCLGRPQANVPPPPVSGWTSSRSGGGCVWRLILQHLSLRLGVFGPVVLTGSLLISAPWPTGATVFPSPLVQRGTVQLSLHAPRGTGQSVGCPLLPFTPPSPSALSPPGAPPRTGVALHFSSCLSLVHQHPKDIPPGNVRSLRGQSLRAGWREKGHLRGRCLR